MWAVEHWGVEPDILLTAKGIACGMPLGAMVARPSCSRRWGPGAHGSTYGGNPVACAAALATIELLEGGLVDNAREPRRAGAGRACGRSVDRYDGLVRDVRGKGLMLGVEFDTARARRGGPVGLLRARPARPRVRQVEPSGCRRPLTVSEAEMATALRIFGEAVAVVAGHGRGPRGGREAGALHEVEAAG